MIVFLDGPRGSVSIERARNKVVKTVMNRASFSQDPMCGASNVRQCDVIMLMRHPRCPGGWMGLRTLQVGPARQ